MTTNPSDSEKHSSKVTFGDVEGGIHDTNIAGRDINFTQKIIHLFIGGKDMQRDLRNRRIMLERVRQYRVEGFLEKSLHQEIQIQLDRQVRQDLIPFSGRKQFKETAECKSLPVPKELSIYEVFQKAGRSLLILGDAGSGKTMTLLELARDAIDRAQKDRRLPIPVVLNLSSWATHQRKLDAWIMEELHLQYQIPKKISKQWVKQGELLLLLDGLDEVRKECRMACIEAINQFLQEHLTEIVVCSRLEDYKMLSKQLRLQKAIVLQPLSQEQIDEYMGYFGDKVATLRFAINTDPVLQELAVSPLKLSIMIIAYHDMLHETLHMDIAEKGYRQLFRRYTQRMLERRRSSERYPDQQTMHWLSWIASQMSEHGSSEFFIENLQPSCLQPGIQQKLYGMYVRVVFGLMLLLALGMGGWIGMIPLGMSFEDIVVLMYLVFAFWGACMLVSVLTIWLPDIVAIGIAILGVTSMLFVLKLTANWKGEPFIGIGLGLLGGLVGRTIKDKTNIRVIEEACWSWKRWFVACIVSGLVGLIGAVVGEVWHSELVIAAELVVGIPVLLVGSVMFGMRRNELTHQPKQGSIWRAVRIDWLANLLPIIASLLYYGILFGYHWQFHGWDKNTFKVIWLIAWSFSVPIGVVSLSKGGFTYIARHFVLRFLLSHYKLLPWNVIDFMEYAVECIFLRRIGRGYTFVHRSLKEYFASLEAQPKTIGGNEL